MENWCLTGALIQNYTIQLNSILILFLSLMPTHHQLELPLKALANANRLHLLREFHGGKSLTVSEAARHLKITVAAASKHLLLLHEAGFVQSTKRGLHVSYRMKVAGLSPWMKAVLKEL